jgi:rod shape-determining protein MreC
LPLLFFLTVQSHSYQKSKFISSTNFVSGTLYSWTHDIDQYFSLEDRNDRLKQENGKLRDSLERFKSQSKKKVLIDSSNFDQPYTFRSAEIIANRYSHKDNYLLLNAGNSDSINTDQGVITDRGIVGIVESSSSNYSRVISILNSQSSISARLKNSNHFGSLTWNAKDPNVVQLIDIPRLAPIKKGDSIVTNGRSFIFPAGIPIGKIQDFKLDEGQSYYHIDVKLFNDMTDIGFVYVIENKNREELEEIDREDGK